MYLIKCRECGLIGCIVFEKILFCSSCGMEEICAIKGIDNNNIFVRKVEQTSCLKCSPPKAKIESLQ